MDPPQRLHKEVGGRPGILSVTALVQRVSWGTTQIRVTTTGSDAIYF